MSFSRPIAHGMKSYAAVSMPNSMFSMGMMLMKEKTLSTADSRLNTTAPIM